MNNRGRAALGRARIDKIDRERNRWRSLCRGKLARKRTSPYTTDFFQQYSARMKFIAARYFYLRITLFLDLNYFTEQRINNF